MDELSQYAYKVANKVALGMLYGETSGNRMQARQMVQESLAATCDLLDRINPVELRDWFEQFESVYTRSETEMVGDPVAWSRFLAVQCDLLHEIGLHQKTIATVGDELAKWNKRPVTFDQLAGALDELAGMVSDQTEVLGDLIEDQSGKVAKSKRRTELFTHSVCGLTIILISINNAIQAGDPREKWRAAMANFGASLVVASVVPLYHACHHQ